MHASIDDAIWAPEVYQFTSTPALDVLAELRVTVFRDGHGVFLVAQSLFEKPKRRELQSKEWEELLRAVRRAAFWEATRWEHELICDGIHWSVEGRKGETRHKLSCFNPIPGPLTDLGGLFLELAQSLS